ncbi:hypothetical protein [Aeromicrobium sp. JJY06]|uniref:hypothetical protein n=1 Tax=Aeromicrobium sp. JJY06 TaxID=3373478 RepID=UPI00376EDAC6
MPGTHLFAPALMEKPTAAHYIAVSPRKFDQLIEQKRVTPYRLDGKRVFKREELDALVANLPEW